MEPVFSLPYSEFCVAQQLSKLLPAAAGYSIYVPISRQQPGVDLILARRRNRRTTVAAIQVKSSRTYSHPSSTRRTRREFRYYTWFNNFDCPPEADFICLIALYPATDTHARRELGSWWAPMVMVFTQKEMRRFLNRVKTMSGSTDKMFAFGFDEPNAVYQTRGDRRRRYADFSDHLLRRRLRMLRHFLAA
jgi:hypothetical protein